MLPVSIFFIFSNQPRRILTKWRAVTLLECKEMIKWMGDTYGP